MISRNIRSLPQPEAALDYSTTSIEGSWLSSSLDVLSRHFTIFGVCLVACFGISAIYTFSSAPCYQGRGVLELHTPPASSYVATGRDGQSQGTVDGQSFHSYIEAQIGILQSDTLVRRVIARLHLADRVRSPNPKWLVWEKKTETPEEVLE